ncbi:hypothetical protein [Streptomyces sp. NPDC087437]|uniref:hypothetical protein n=1 Tax=Streptomyces sp. NPDC087437 TaxID=3365789 RepID=UPI0037F3273C
MTKPLPNVCEEPEPVRRVWAQLREELGINLLHHDRQRVFDVIAHELAEQIREDVDLDTHPGEAVYPCEDCATVRAANQIDPKAKP